VVTTRSHVISTPPHTPAAARGASGFSSAPTELLRLLLIGQELRVEGLQMLLATQADMELLSPISDLDQVTEVLLRLRGTSQRVHEVVMDWDGPFEKNYAILKFLASLGLRCLVISSLIYPSELEQIEQAGAWGFCFTATSRQQLAQIIRKIASGKKCFRFPEQTAELLPNLKLKRRMVFYKERLQARAEEIGWELNEKDIDIIYNIYTMSGEKTPAIAQQVHLEPGTLRTQLSTRIFFYLQLLSERQVSDRLTAFQVLLEYGVIDYK
jgi:DNA-binding NarL/FixJ family response regulator